MVWFKVDDALSMHMKAFTAGNQALGLWVRAGSWSMHQLSDGFIPKGVVQALGGDWDDAAALINAGLWHEAEGGYVFHDWAEYQPTRESVLADREAAAERMRRVRANKQANEQKNAQGTNGDRSATPSRPVPTPDSYGYVPESSHVGNRARETDEKKSIIVNSLTGLGVSAGRVQAQVMGVCDRAVTLDGAARVALHILAKRDEPPKNAQAYVMGSITKSWAEVQNYIDTEGVS